MNISRSAGILRSSNYRIEYGLRFTVYGMPCEVCRKRYNFSSQAVRPGLARAVPKSPQGDDLAVDRVNNPEGLFPHAK